MLHFHFSYTVFQKMQGTLGKIQKLQEIQNFPAKCINLNKKKNKKQHKKVEWEGNRNRRGKIESAVKNGSKYFWMGNWPL